MLSANNSILKSNMSALSKVPPSSSSRYIRRLEAGGSFTKLCRQSNNPSLPLSRLRDVFFRRTKPASSFSSQVCLQPEDGPADDANAGSDLANTGDAGRCESMWSIRDQMGFSSGKICKKDSGVTISLASYEPSVSKS